MLRLGKVSGVLGTSVLFNKQQVLFSSTPLWRGLEQLADVPTSTTRKPKGMHRGPGRRQTSLKEMEGYRFMKKWDLQMQEKWDDYEAFKGQPKPKKQYGNEACEIVWPYTVLMENIVKVHRFTKGIYVYYPRYQTTPTGRFSTEVAKRFSRQYLIPITFHNSQVYVETEMLLEYGETPWIVLHCLDNSHQIIPIKFNPPATSVNTENGNTEKSVAFQRADIISATQELLSTVCKKSIEMGESVNNVSEVLDILNVRPPQNQYVRVNYQWFGDTPEERMSHLVQWNLKPEDIVPGSTYMQSEVQNKLNFDGRLPMSKGCFKSVHTSKNLLLRRRSMGSKASFLNSSVSRQNARWAKNSSTQIV
eukprot:Tbor_TRINITY_DN1941_c0_g1::TRINITY_DN1941_c0_g1_i1::g.3528::m.3528